MNGQSETQPTDPRVRAGSEELYAHHLAEAESEDSRFVALPADEWDCCAKAVIAAADAADREAGYVSEETVERCAQVLYALDHGQWISGKGLKPGGTPWGTSQEKTYQYGYRMRARAVLDVLATLTGGQS